MSSGYRNEMLLNNKLYTMSKKFSLLLKEFDELKVKVSYLENKLNEQNSKTTTKSIIEDLNLNLDNKFNNFENKSNNKDSLILSDSVDLINENSTNKTKGFVKRKVDQSIKLNKDWLTKF